MTRVAIFGGGIAGLTAAHELVERGFEVTVYEKEAVLGGKARSFRYEAGAAPGEHGLRFYPGFYTHLDDTMRRIPYRDQPQGVLDNLVTTGRSAFLRCDRAPVHLFAHFPRRLSEVRAFVEGLRAPLQTDVALGDLAYFAHRLLGIASASESRLLAEAEDLSWEALLDTSRNEGGDYYTLLAEGWTRSFTAVQPDLASARTLGTTLLRMVGEQLRPGSSVDRVMNGPTSEKWLEPWGRHLARLGVEFRCGMALRRLELEGSRVSQAWVAADDQLEPVIADHFLCALPIEAARRLLDPDLARAAPSLARARQLETRLMAGVQLFLDRPFPIVDGHVHYGDSPWALTSISQAQFWPGVDLGQSQGKPVRDVLSVCVSDWQRPGRYVTDAPAMALPPETLAREIWAQLRAHFPAEQAAALSRCELLGWGVDPRIADPLTRGQRCEPLFVSTTGCWHHRPEARTELDNLFLAGDWIRTSVDVACMEGANEAGRRACDAILRASNSQASRSRLGDLPLPAPAEAARRIDAMLFAAGVERRPGRRRATA
jgi:uncharacterized protein with NAD-binding domain and iron-sulfur cluster